MYSISNRFNVILYNMMFGMLSMGLLNYFNCYYGEHTIRDTSFSLDKMDLFTNDRFYDEHAAAFTFNFKADIRGLFNWNTNIIFASLVCEYESPQGPKNAITVWDQRIKREAPEFHEINLEREWVEYYLTDIHKSLKGKEINVYLRWE